MKEKQKIIIYWLITAILIGFISGIYHLFIPRWTGTETYTPLALSNQSPSTTFDEVIFYATKTRESLDGHYLINDPFVWEYKTTPSPVNLGESWPAFLMAILAKITGSVPNAFIVADFVWPPVVFLSLTYFIYRLTGQPYFAPLVATVTIFFSKYFHDLPYVPSIIKIIFIRLNTGWISDIGRSFHMEITWPFFLLFTTLFWLIQTKKKINHWLVLSLGLTLGLLFYTYIFFWTYACAWLGVTMIESFFEKNFRLGKKLLISMLIALIIAGPYLINFWQFFQLPAISQSFMQNGQMPPAKDLRQLLFLATFFGASLLLTKKKWVEKFWPQLYLAGAGLILSLKLTGIHAEEMVDHWMIRIVYPFSVIFLFLCLRQLLKKWLNKSANQKIIICLTLILIAYQFRIQWQYFKLSAQAYSIEPERLEALNWLDKTTPKDSVVATAELTNNLYLPVYTHNNVVIPRGFLSIVPAEEALDRFLIVNKIAAIPENRIKDMFTLTASNLEMKKRGRFNFDDCAGHHLFFRRFIGRDYYNCAVPEEKLAEILDKYREIKPDFRNYRADYWLWGPYEKQWAQLNPEKIDGWEKLWENLDYQIYKIDDSND